MKERLVTLALAMGALALFYALFLPKPVAPQDTLPLPVSTEVRDEGYQGLWRWLAAQGVRAESFRGRYDKLTRQDLPGTGNLLIATLPQQVPVRAEEFSHIDQWIGRGNTLLVLAALDDTPAWAQRASTDFLIVLQRLARLGVTPVPEKEEKEVEIDADATSPSRALRQALQAALAPRRMAIIARGTHPLMAGVQSVEAQSRYPASRWTAHNLDASALLEIAVRGDRTDGSAADEPAIWLKRHGQGQIIVMGFASPFSNALIGKQDNARLFANIVGWSLADGGAVLFDDAHQGLADYYDAKAFFADPRLHRTLLWIGALWLLFVLGWQRIRPAADGWNPADVTGFIKVTGGFLAGRVAPGVVGQRLFENFFNGIRRRLALPQDGQPMWDWLAAQASVRARDLEQLRRLHERAPDLKRSDLIQLQNCLTKIAEDLL